MAIVTINFADAGKIRRLVSRSVGSSHTEAVSICCHEVKTPNEALAQLCSNGEILAVQVFGIVKQISAHLTINTITYVFVYVGRTFFGFSWKLDAITQFVA